MRKNIVAGNWKMNMSPKAANELYGELCELKDWPTAVQMMIFPPVLYLQNFAEKANTKVMLGIQNFFPKDKGAYTGEISIAQAVEVGAQILLIGHSERRAYFGEHEAFLKEKVDAAVSHKSHFIFCCGEPLDVRESGSQDSFVQAQLENSLFHLSAEEMLLCTIAYEPVWAIGTGRTASMEEAEAMHAAIRAWLTDKYGMELANKVSLLYGGSCNAENAKELFACPNVDGGLIGGASLDATTFKKIAQSF